MDLRLEIGIAYRMIEKAYNIRNEDTIVGMKSLSLSCFGILGKGVQSGVKQQLENSFGTFKP